jgi:polyhydroxyalkanoate synthesis regulator phasin
MYSISYEQFVVPLVKAMQEQQVMIDNLNNQLINKKIAVSDNSYQEIIANQQKQIDLLEKRLSAIEAK